MRRRAFCVLVAAGVVAGCGVGPTTPPPPTTGPTHGTTTTAVAPPVDRPVDLTPHVDEACSLLSARQVADLGFPGDAPLPEQINGCSWMNAAATGSFAVLAVTVHLDGDPLAAAYRENARRDDNRGTTFAEHTVRGLPAVAVAVGYSESQCEVTVGAGNGQGIVILGHLFVGDEKPPLCDRLVTAAGWVVDAVRR